MPRRPDATEHAATPADGATQQPSNGDSLAADLAAASEVPQIPAAGSLVTPTAADTPAARDLAGDLAERQARAQLLTNRAARFAATAPSMSPGRLAWRRLKKNRLAVAGGWVLIVLYAAALFAQFLAPYSYDSQDPAAPFRPPMLVHFTPGPTVYRTTYTFDQYRDRIFIPDVTHPIHIRLFARGPAYRLFGLIPSNIHLFGATGPDRVYLLGTDQFGRDYLSRLLYGAQISLSVGLFGVAITFTLGLLVGGISGFYGGRVDDVIMRLCELVMSIPDFYLLLALAATLPPTLSPAVVFLLIIAILSLVGWAGMARIIRGMVLSAREREYVEAARALGVSDGRIIVRHVLPNTFTFAIVAATLTIPAYMLSEASLSFLGLGIRDPMPSWGNMLSAAQDLSTLEHSLWILTPGLMIFVATLAFNFLGDGLRDALDPKAK